jgi:hemoglobin
MAEAHAGLGITDAAFDRVVDHLVATLQEAQVPPAEIAEVGAALGPLREHIVTV